MGVGLKKKQPTVSVLFFYFDLTNLVYFSDSVFMNFIT